jgi:hypothetical protein
MKKLKFLIPFLALMLNSCDEYLDVNDDPNRLLLSQTGPEKLLPSAQVRCYSNQATRMNELGSVWTNAWASNVASFTGGFALEFQLNVDPAFYRDIFENTFLRVANFNYITKQPNADHKNDYFVAAAKICKAHYMQYMVDLYGDVPYTDAWQLSANPNPRYNDDQFVYRQLLNELDEARALIIAADPNATDIAPYDVMLAGDMSKWYDFANTIELRMLLRMSNSTGAVAAYRNARIAALPASFVTTDVTINPGYNASTDDQYNPTNGRYSFDAAGAATQNWTFIAMSGHLFKSTRLGAAWNGTEVVPGSGVFYPAVNDFRSGGGTGGMFRSSVRAVTQGSTTVDVPGTAGLPGRIGYGLLNPYGIFPAAASVADVQKMAKSNGFVMTASESFLLQAEAGLRPEFAALGLAGSVQANFDAGVNASFDRLGITIQLPTAAATYSTAINSKANYGLGGSTTFNQKLHAIMYQKWMALAGIHGIESFIEYNRTGFPVTPNALTAPAGSRKPRRLIYPTSEYIANAANVPNITPAMIFATTDPSHPFWMLGNPPLGN